MRRHSQNSIFNRYDGKRVYRSSIYPPIPPSSTDVQIICNETDCLDSLAYKFYKDTTLWVFIAAANPGIGRGRLSVPPGTILRIPTNISQIIDRYNKANS